MGGNKLKKKEVIRKLISVVIVIGIILFVLGLLSLFGIINMDAMPIILLSAGLFNISNGYYAYTKNKKSAIFIFSCGLFSIFVAVLIFF